MNFARFLALVVLLGAGCQPERREPSGARPAEPSPNASILPAPLSSDLGTRSDGLDAGRELVEAGVDAGTVVAATMRHDTPLSEDSTLAEEPSGTRLQARWRWLDVELPSRLPEANAEAIERMRGELAFDFAIELSTSGQLRLSLAADSFFLPRGSELRARLDLFGHSLIWPDRSRYAVLAPGSLRALFNERRSDVVPLTRPKPVAQGSGQLLEFVTERQKLTTPHGRVDLEQARIAGSGLGGLLLCRMLLELLAAHPDSPLCAADTLPLRAEYTWTDGGRAAFEVTKVSKATDLDPATFSLVPARALFVRGELPGGAPPLLVADESFSRFRLRALPKVGRADKPDKAEKRDALAVKEGLLVVNRGELAAYLLIDGVPVLRALPRSEDVALPLVPGTYHVAARDFLGTVTVAQNVVSVPARLVLSELADAER
jgi:hypothetical protein